MAARLASLALRFPEVFLLALVGSILLAALGTPRLYSVSYLESSIAPDDPELARYRALQREFGSDRLAILVIGCGEPHPCETVFDPAPLALVRRLSGVAAAQRGVEAVDSLATTSVLVGRDGTLRDVTLPPGPGGDIASFREAVVRDPLLVGTLVSRDLRTTAVVVRFEGRLGDDALNGIARELLTEAQAAADAAGFRLFVSGDVAFTAVTDGYVRADLVRLTPVMIALLFVIVVLVFRDALSAGLAMVTVGIPALWVFGLMGWTGRPISPITSTLPILILVVGVTDAVHFLVRVHDLRASGPSLRAVVHEVAAEVGPPTTITAITSSLGFLSLLAGGVPSIRDFGLFAAAGIMGGWLLTFTLIPVVVVRLGLPARAKPPPVFALSERLIAAIRTSAHRRAGVVLTLAGVATVVSVYGLTRLVPENDTLAIIGPEDPLVESVHFIDHRLRPTASLEVVFEPAEGVDLLAPSTLARLERVETLLRDEGDGAPVVSVLPLLREANREVAGGAATLPENLAGAAQLLLLAEAAAPDRVRRVVTPDRRVARLSGGYDWGSGEEVQADLERLRASLAAILDDGGTWFATGSVFLAARMGALILRTQVASFSTAFLTIFAVIFLYIRSVRLGILGVIPNAFPVLVILGAMGLTGIRLDVATAMIASIVLGISVDDTMYFLTHYRKARLGGADMRDAVAFTFAVAGKPALYCMVVLASGFLVLAFSSFQGLAVFGLLSAVAVVLAGVSELFLMPAVIEVVRRWRAER